MTSVQSNARIAAAATANQPKSIRSAMTRDQLLAMARNEYARQLSRYTEAQLKKRVPSCHTHPAYYYSTLKKSHMEQQPKTAASRQ